MHWLVPSLVFVAVAGLIGVTSKVALRGLGPSELFLWAAIAYAVAGLAAIAGGAGLTITMPGTICAVATGALAATGLALRFVAVRGGEVSAVIPITAGYPVVSVVIAALALGEALGPERALGTGMVVAGVAILGQS